MTHIEAMRQWLSAIERVNEIDGMYSWKDEEDSLRQAITTAVAEQHKESSAVQEPVVWKVSPRYEDCDGYFDFTETEETAKTLEKRGWSIQPLYTHPYAATPRQPKAEQCLHRLVDVTNPVVKSGYMCIDCGAVFRAAFESQPKAEQEPKREWVGLTDNELAEFSEMKLGSYDLCLEVEANLRVKNT